MRSGRQPRIAPRFVPRSFLVLLALLASLTLVALGHTTSADAATGNEACSGNSGVTVVVDATNAGGGIVVRCALGPQASGWAALEAAGFALSSPPRFPGTAVCQIDGLPASGYPDCWETNVWWYSHADSVRASGWADSAVGATAWQPPAGSIEGWKYRGLSDPDKYPAVAPTDLATPTPTTPAPPPPANTGTPNAGTGDPGTAPNASGGGSPADARASGGAVPSVGTSVPGADAGVTTTVPGDTSSTSAAPAENRERTELVAGEDDDENTREQQQVASTRDAGDNDGDGPPIATIVGVALIVALLGGAAFFAVRRRTGPQTT